MADPEQLKILKQGVREWNAWREMHPGIEPDLAEASLIRANLAKADLIRANLTGVHLIEADLRGAKLVDANLARADLGGANLRSAKLTRADLSKAYLVHAILQHVDLAEANLAGANLQRTNLSSANLCDASLKGANLQWVDLSMAILARTKMSDAWFEHVILSFNDLSETMGLSDCSHIGPSELGYHTLMMSKDLPESFLKGCGLQDWEIEATKLHARELCAEEITRILYRIHDLRVQRVLLINPLFISYAHDDKSFVAKIEEVFKGKGIRYWRDVHHATAGRLEKQVDQAMRLHPIVLLILSEHATKSDWVQHEVRLARELEKETGRDVLCPIALDDSWKSCGLACTAP